MKKYSFIILLSCLFALIQINLQAQVNTFVADSVDFSSIKTYNFLGWQKHSDSLLSEVDKNRLHSAFKSEFDARNLTYVEKGGDMSVSLFLFITEEIDTYTYLVYNQSREYDSTMTGYGAYTATSHTLEDDYNKGTLILDCYENKENTLIFQSIMEKIIEENPDKREKTIPRSVGKIMKKFPLKKQK